MTSTLLQQAVEAALRRSFNLGQLYWQQADSESYKQNAKADATQAKFDALVAETVSALQQQEEPREVASLPVPPKITAIIERLHMQDNRITSHPLFAVQQKRIIAGLDSEYADQFAWVDYEGECSPEDSNLYDAKRENGESLPDGVRRVGFIEKWEFVTGCMTEQGCKDFIACNGHNLNEPRIYAYSGYRNAEFIALREWLMSLRAASPSPQDFTLPMLEEGKGVDGVEVPRG